jgi:bacterial leucyl aminopeptidase
MLRSALVLLLSTQFALGASFQDKQAVLVQSPELPIANAQAEHVVDEAILAALKTHFDPVAALLSLQPELAADLTQERLLHVVGEQKPEWMTEGDKRRRSRPGKKFVDITDHEEFYAQQVGILSGKASESLLSPVKVLLFTLLQISPT